MSTLKAVHSPRRVAEFVRISVADSRMKFDDGKEFEPTGNAFQVKGTLTNAATLDPLTRLPHFMSVLRQVNCQSLQSSVH